ncbi:MAG TPA: DUF3857 domain-containing protein [Chitinophagaceae bacterium]|nr:DUF3857 domain-containing protein [Chitinophagaceae bacterium]
MRAVLLLLFSFAGIIGSAQDYSKVKFGDVSAKDFSNTVYRIDSSASAVILCDIGSSKIEGNSKGWFSLVYKRHRRVHILNKNGYDLSNVTIPVYSKDDDEEKLDKVRAVTYNLENGKIVETKLDTKTGVFRDKIDKNRGTRKFTLPNVKEGSIIEYEYTIISDFLNHLRPWEYQGTYPRLWSEYNLSLPEFLGYVFLTQGYKKYDIDQSKTRYETFQVIDNNNPGAMERYVLSSNVTDYHWVMKNVNPLKEEGFTSSLDNHIAKIEFQLSEYRAPLMARQLIESWKKVAEDMMKAEFFGQHVKADDPWVEEITAPLKEISTNKMELAQKIYAYVRDNYTCIDHDRRTMDQSLKNLIKTKKGNVAEINLLLTAMLLDGGIHAYPVLLSTRSNGFVYSVYPLLQQYNYVITRAFIDGNPVYLDASHPLLGFGHLPLQCYNDEARAINDVAEVLLLSADSLTEVKYSTIFMVNDEKGNLVGSMNQTPGYYESLGLREKIKEKGKEQLQKDIEKDFGTEIVTSNFGIDSLTRYDDVLGIHYDFDLKAEKEDIIYFNPMFGEGYKENPFKSAERFYPVEMPYAMDETYNLQMEVPKGYVVDELPKSMVVKLNEENHGMFEYRVSQSGNNISFRSRVKLSRAYFIPEEYEMLREFFNLIVKKQAEQIVFKKKS